MCMRGKDLQLGFRTDPCLRKGLVRAACQSSCFLVVNSALSNVFRNRFDLMCETINGLRVFYY